MALSSNRGDLNCILEKFPHRVTKQWNRLPRKMVESPFVEVFRRCVDVALVHMV